MKKLIYILIAINCTSFAIADEGISIFASFNRSAYKNVTVSNLDKPFDLGKADFDFSGGAYEFGLGAEIFRFSIKGREIGLNCGLLYNSSDFRMNSEFMSIVNSSTDSLKLVDGRITGRYKTSADYAGVFIGAELKSIVDIGINLSYLSLVNQETKYKETLDNPINAVFKESQSKTRNEWKGEIDQVNSGLLALGINLSSDFQLNQSHSMTLSPKLGADFYINNIVENSDISYNVRVGLQLSYNLGHKEIIETKQNNIEKTVSEKQYNPIVLAQEFFKGKARDLIKLSGESVLVDKYVIDTLGNVTQIELNDAYREIRFESDSILFTVLGEIEPGYSLFAEIYDNMKMVGLEQIQNRLVINLNHYTFTDAQPRVKLVMHDRKIHSTYFDEYETIVKLTKKKYAEYRVEIGAKYEDEVDRLLQVLVSRTAQMQVSEFVVSGDTEFGKYVAERIAANNDLSKYHIIYSPNKIEYKNMIIVKCRIN